MAKRAASLTRSTTLEVPARSGTRRGKEAVTLQSPEATASFMDAIWSGVSAATGDRPRVPWQPLPGPQEMALTSKAHVIGFGGAPGGGKTDIILGRALQKHLKSVIFRSEGAQLADMIDRSREIIGDEGRLNVQNGLWRDLPAGATITFSGLKDMTDISKHRGRARDFMGFDEVTEMPRDAVETVLTWNRSAVPGQECCAIMTFNPPTTPEAEWVIEYFAPWLDPEHENPAEPGELRWFARIDGQEVMMPDDREFVVVDGQAKYDFDRETVKVTDVVSPRSRTFFPATVKDNPYLMASGYISTLQALPEPLRTMMLEGAFNVAREEDPWQFVSSALVNEAQARWVPTKPDDATLLALGVDCSRGGKDNGVIERLYGGTRIFDEVVMGIPVGEPVPVLWYAPPVKVAGSKLKRGPDLVAEVLLYWEEGAVINIDVIGIGSSPYDYLCDHFGRDAAKIVNPINNGAGAPKKKVRRDGKVIDAPATDISGRIQFARFRSYSFWVFKELLEGKNVVDRWAKPARIEPVLVELPPDRELKADLCVAKWSLTGGKAQIESKEDLKLRLPSRRSPDVGDAAILAAVIRGVQVVEKRPFFIVSSFQGE